MNYCTTIVNFFMRKSEDKLQNCSLKWNEFAKTFTGKNYH